MDTLVRREEWAISFWLGMQSLVYLSLITFIVTQLVLNTVPCVREYLYLLSTCMTHDIILNSL